MPGWSFLYVLHVFVFVVFALVATLFAGGSPLPVKPPSLFWIAIKPVLSLGS
jgi:hypothetical protein